MLGGSMRGYAVFEYRAFLSFDVSIVLSLICFPVPIYLLLV
jgi:hypothetical protein